MTIENVPARGANAILETERLRLREIVPDDAQFILALLNEPSFLRYIGDKGVRTLDDARAYIVNGPAASYETNGFGLYLVALKEGGAPVGMCGLVRRPTLPNVDIGYAFLPGYWGKGYAVEAARAVLDYGESVLAVGNIIAIASVDNTDSAKLLAKIGLRFERLIKLGDNEEEVALFSRP